MENAPVNLPKELTQMVNKVLELLGDAIKLEHGIETYDEVEKIRMHYKNVRLGSPDRLFLSHTELSKQLKPLSPSKKIKIAHCFTLALELINASENAYRSMRLKSKKSPISTQEGSIVFVLTAHPTESRSPQCVSLLGKITDILEQNFENQSEKIEGDKQLLHLILLFLKIPISKQTKPTVLDEAEYIYSTVFQQKNFDILIEKSDSAQPLVLRSWVGGDKDGHPGVNEKVMLGSLKQSRKHIVQFIMGEIDKTTQKLTLLSSENHVRNRMIDRVLGLKVHLKGLNSVGEKDGKDITRFSTTLMRTCELYVKSIGVDSPDLLRIVKITNLFPALVIPLEFREDSAEIEVALKDRSLNIVKMIQTLKKISRGGSPDWYVKGFVVSMCESSQDLQNATTLLEKHLGNLDLPIIPLFETRQALDTSSQIVQDFLKDRKVIKALKEKWDSKVEIMLGYSDSAKESGALYSRVMIRQTLVELDRLIKKSGYEPIFFHGSGGSVARGGGSLERQISWWPQSARRRFKATIQGEMVYRSFSSPEILARQIEKIQSATMKKFNSSAGGGMEESLVPFAKAVGEKYYTKVRDPSFLEVVKMATPYPYLDHLKIGSRPSKRKSNFELKSLRAIPWVLCWTQTRALFPVWFGVGSSWMETDESEKQKLIELYSSSDFMNSFVQTLAYSIAKVDLSVWKFYMHQSDLDDTRVESVYQEFKEELKRTTKFITDVSGESQPLWFRSWLSSSINLRSTFIYPLNILSVDAIRREDMPLLRETVTGIASGMLTTG